MKKTKDSLQKYLAEALQKQKSENRNKTYSQCLADVKQRFRPSEPKFKKWGDEIFRKLEDDCRKLDQLTN